MHVGSSTCNADLRTQTMITVPQLSLLNLNGSILPFMLQLGSLMGRLPVFSITPLEIQLPASHSEEQGLLPAFRSWQDLWWSLEGLAASGDRDRDSIYFWNIQIIKLRSTLFNPSISTLKVVFNVYFQQIVSDKNSG